MRPGRWHAWVPSDGARGVRRPTTMVDGVNEPSQEEEIGTILRPRRAAGESADDAPRPTGGPPPATEPQQAMPPTGDAVSPPAQGLAVPPPPGPAAPGRSAARVRPTGASRLVSDLDLNASVPPRAVPMLGDWGPVDVPSTREKKRARWVTPVALVAAVAVVALAWHQFFLMLG